MVGVSKIQRQNANYWIEAVAGGEEDYYTKPGESPGRWLGAAAAELGLSGEIGRDAYAAALAGRHPRDGTELVRRPPPRVFCDRYGRERRAEPVMGFDVRFAAPKSISLLYALGSASVREAVLRCHEQAIEEAIAYLERHACFVGRGKGGVRIEPGKGFVAMGFRHRSSRAGDPALHTHVLIANLTRARSDGRWLSLASPRRRSALFVEAKPAGYLYQAALRSTITRELGLSWGPLRNGYADLELFEREVIDHFSRRRAEIEQAMAERGSGGARAAEVAAYRTRDRKDYGVDPDSQRSEWRARAAEFGYGAPRIEAAIAEQAARVPPAITAETLDAAIAELESTRAQFSRRDLLCALAGALGEGANAEQVEMAVGRALQGKRVVEIDPAQGPLAEAIYSTPRLIELERRVIEFAERGRRGCVGVIDAALREEVIARHPYLGADQRAMLEGLLGGGEALVLVAARPGAGKTTALAAAREAWEAAGVCLIGVASARSAAGELSDAGVPATSITALLVRAQEWAARGVEPLDRGTVILLDEASTVSTPDFAALVELVEGCGGKLVAIGDPRQIGAIGPGGLFAHLSRREQALQLSEIRRQRDPAERRVVEIAHQGRGSDAIDLLRSRKRLRIADTLPDALDAQVLDWNDARQRGEDAVMIARRRRDVAALNERARALLGERPGPVLCVGGAEFRAGEQLVTRINTSAVSNRERWQLVAVDPDGGAELARIGGDGRRVRLGALELRSLSHSGAPAIEHAYAITAYSAESKTFDSAFVLLDAGATREEFLVAVSRARGQTCLYGVAALELSDPELGPATRAIEDPAHDLRFASEREGSGPAAEEAATGRRLAELSPPELCRRRSQLRESSRGPWDRGAKRLAAIGKREAQMRAQLEAASEAQEALRAQPRAERHHLERLGAERDLAERQLERLLGERVKLEAALASAGPAHSRSTERVELALIEERLTQLRRREVAAERLESSPMVIEALGERPGDPRRAIEWNEGVETIYSYRLAHGVNSHNPHPLGTPPRRTAARRHWAQAERRLREIGEQLGIESRLSRERSVGLARST